MLHGDNCQLATALARCVAMATEQNNSSPFLLCRVSLPSRPFLTFLPAQITLFNGADGLQRKDGAKYRTVMYSACSTYSRPAYSHLAAPSNGLHGRRNTLGEALISFLSSLSRPSFPVLALFDSTRAHSTSCTCLKVQCCCTNIDIEHNEFKLPR